MHEIDLTTATPQEYLAYLQRKCAPHGYPRWTTHAIEKFIERAVEAFSTDETCFYPAKDLRKRILDIVRKNQSQELPTELENPECYALISRYGKHVVEIAVEHGLEVPSEIVLGSLTTGEVNAITIRVPAGGTIVAVNAGMFLFLHLSAKAVSSFFAAAPEKDGSLVFSYSEDDLRDAIGANQEGHIRFTEVLFAYLVLGHPGFARQYFQTGPQQLIASLFRDTAEMYVVAHEYSHLIYGHLGSPSAYRKRMLGPTEIEELSFNWGQEFQADNLALKLTLSYNSKKRLDLSLSYAGIDFLFSLMDIVERAAALGNSTSHPPARVRREMLRDWLRQKFSNGAGVPIQLAQLIQSLIEELWKRNEPAFRSLRSAWLSGVCS